ncbi:hypothetical protein GLA29479_423 [Lysobacter antibioticus]|uniref:hypothetical protein n=1 Tax=Lysobacter antibioticus TaxID=84531 RepID=UPI00071F0134|nr:hypothetical protein [Lysobacter antibioticus]ALN61309.1 hypothetical protein GLA29479_423 [Lysobacter antibioticus]
MLNRIRQLFKPVSVAHPTDYPAPPPPDTPEIVMHWLADTRQPLADWERIAEAERPD